MCCLSSKQSEVLSILQCAGKGLDAYDVFRRTSRRFTYRYEVEDTISSLYRQGYIYRSWGRYYVSCCAPVYCAPVRTVVVQKTVYVPVVAVQIPTPVALPPKKSYVEYLIECAQKYMIPVSAEAYLAG